MRIVVIGGSAAGGSLCETARQLDPLAAITLVTREPWPMYSRCLLPKYVGEEKKRAELAFRPGEWSTQLNVRVVRGAATRISAAEHFVELETGVKIGYDKLGVATGARPSRPPIPGLDAVGVFDLYSMASADALKAWLPRVKCAVVLGAGLIGMKVAAALVRLNVQVTIVEKKSTVMPDTLDARAAERMSNLFAARGVSLLTSETVDEILTRNDHEISSVRLASGRTSKCDMLVCAVGTVPNAELIRNAGGITGQGARVNEYLETSLSDVYAVGDVAEAPMLHTERVLAMANWFNSKREGRIAAFNMLGGRTSYPGRVRGNAVELLGMAMVSVGQVSADSGEHQVFDDPSSASYRHLVFNDTRLAGFVLLGDISAAGALTELVQSGRTVKPVKDRLLREGAACLPSLSLATMWKRQEPVAYTNM